ncbi:MAG: helix-turn-helix domain-containing protein [Dehalococcoidia bacterium]
MTAEEVAEFLQVDTRTVYRLIRRKQLAATRTGRTYRIPRQDLDTFLLTNSSRPEVRTALFNRALAHAEQANPGADGDAILDQLEQLDEERKRRAASQ